jgi:uncharacterized membrane protein (DUF485 family)
MLTALGFLVIAVIALVAAVIGAKINGKALAITSAILFGLAAFLLGNPLAGGGGGGPGLGLVEMNFVLGFLMLTNIGVMVTSWTIAGLIRRERNKNSG